MLSVRGLSARSTGAADISTAAADWVMVAVFMCGIVQERDES